MHAMRGISAHSNGFHTCRALHLLQMLLGTIDVPGRLPLQAALSRSRRRPVRKPRGKPGDVQPSTPLPGMPLGFPTGPEDLLVDADGTPLRIDKAFLGCAARRARPDAHGDRQCLARGDPYPIDTLFMYMANMALELVDEHAARRSRMLTDKDATTGEYKIPLIIYSDAYFSETVAYADLVLPDTTYLER